MSFDPNEFDRSYPRSGGETLGQYVGKTFLWMMVGLLVTFGVGILVWSTGLAWHIYVSAPGVHLVLLVGILIISFTLSTRIERMAVGTAVALFLTYSALFGFTVSLYLVLFELPSVMLAFLMTAVYFGALAAYGFLTRADLSRLGVLLTAGLILLILFALASLLIPGLTGLDRAVSFFAIAVFHAHEHQIARANRGDFLFVHGYARVRNPLHYTTHNGLLVIGSRDRLRSRRSACATA